MECQCIPTVYINGVCSLFCERIQCAVDCCCVVFNQLTWGNTVVYISISNLYYAVLYIFVTGSLTTPLTFCFLILNFSFFCSRRCVQLGWQDLEAVVHLRRMRLLQLLLNAPTNAQQPLSLSPLPPPGHSLLLTGSY